LVVEGRIKDVINRGGEKISAAELEDLLLEHPNVDDAAMVGVEDSVLGEKTCAFVVGKTPIGLEGMRRFLADHGVAEFKLPDRIEWTEALPRTGMGKIDKVALRRRALDAVRGLSSAR
jgi:2,3-dihydroxybenzoate-AMP ligase